jgi:hypothetical protein
VADFQSQVFPFIGAATEITQIDCQAVEEVCIAAVDIRGTHGQPIDWTAERRKFIKSRTATRQGRFFSLHARESFHETSLGAISFLQLGSVVGLEPGHNHTMAFKRKAEERRVASQKDMVRALLSLPPGEYKATAEGKKLCQREGEKVVAKAGGGFYQKMGSCDKVENLVVAGKVGLAIGVSVFVAASSFFVLRKCALKVKAKAPVNRLEPPMTGATALARDEIGK